MPHYENNAPFEIPESWEWCRLSEIASYGGGKTPSMDNKQYWLNGSNLWITSKDMKSERITDSMMKISDDALDIMTQYEPGTLLMVTRSGILRHSLPIAILKEKATVNQDLKTISLHLKEVHEYVYYAIKARERYILKEYHKDGTTVDSINFEKFAEIPLPIPPYDEQKRIVATIKQWFSFIDELEQEANDLETSIQQIKSKILDLAIHGKLVPQDPNDEPAIELLKRINPNFEPCDNAHYPFEIPNNWVWVKHNDVMDISGGAQPAKSYFSPIPQPNYIRLYQIRDYGDMPIPVYIPIELASKQTKQGDILLARYGGSLGKVFIAENGAYNVAMAKIIFKYEGIIDKGYAYHYYLSDIYQGKLKEISRTAQAGFNSNDFNEMLIPLPPLSEQLRIVAKIEELFTLIDTISNSLKT